MGNFRNLAAASNTHSPYASLSHPPLSLNFIWVAEKMHICQLCILLAAIWLCRFCYEASTMMRYTSLSLSGIPDLLRSLP
ncbi:unnamed protein product [Prunus brigantina]